MANQVIAKYRQQDYDYSSYPKISKMRWKRQIFAAFLRRFGTFFAADEGDVASEVDSEAHVKLAAG